MDLVQLILTVCALAQPADCEEQRLAFVDSGSVAQCLSQAPPKIAEWSRSHPARRVVRWRCGYPEVEGTKIRARDPGGHPPPPSPGERA